MGAISGQEYINRINQLNPEIWVDGKRISGLLSEHPHFKGILQSKASLYDLQHHPKIKHEMTFQSPQSGNAVGLSFLAPKTIEDLKKRGKMIEHWAAHSHGIMGRSPDYLNSVLMSFASSSGYLQGKENSFPENLIRLYDTARENDLTFTHTFITPQVNRSQLHLENGDAPIAARVVDENEEGIVINGARLLATQGGLTDEVLVFSIGKFIFNEEEAFAFSIPSNTKGLKFICRDTFIGGESEFDHPLSSKYEEMDSIVVFDNVLVPWERVFFYNNGDVAEEFLEKCSFNAFAKHQVLIRQIVKTEFILGIAQLLIKTINVREYQHIQEKMSEIIIGIETLKALLEKSENHASLDEWGYMRPDVLPLKVAGNLFPKMYPRFIEIIQLIGASGIITLPTEQAFHSPIRNDLDQYLQAATKPAYDRVKIFRLAWDLSMSAFGTRQTQYERYFFGDPIRLSSELYNSYPVNDYVSKVNQFLKINND
ncbi:4-hydroxyphenylacetate 3-monooxygenase, oxygenase component [Lysinibacillus sp. SGAir0095]|uniref:4-hydroxyphenylacetate 3-monooxygenase, oxygenase component n=1 Tax=Lysinibacillus sp. SGAir0095 TaxID=2070463 RepID=UPI0010CCBFF3|nr:4-hydroxyphenylacetate 3-monooxygenase, oxygenase component [Lysinibacillus sp. SGAir0095]QCR32734.1 4-hydroxyphenylacetate 3-monooxygenase, oxygenase component [Lysinibacillus sp. SGAir0095]